MDRLMNMVGRWFLVSLISIAAARGVEDLILAGWVSRGRLSEPDPYATYAARVIALVLTTTVVVLTVLDNQRRGRLAGRAEVARIGLSHLCGVRSNGMQGQVDETNAYQRADGLVHVLRSIVDANERRGL